MPTDSQTPSAGNFDPAIVVTNQKGETNDSNSTEKEFDAYATQYEAALNEGLSVSGEGPEYFAQRRIDWTAKIVDAPSGKLASVLDFGCGVGIATPMIQLRMNPGSIWGFDPSSAAIVRAKQEYGNASVHFTHSSEAIPQNHFELAYCNGVFHHIMPEDLSLIHI